MFYWREQVQAVWIPLCPGAQALLHRMSLMYVRLDALGALAGSRHCECSPQQRFNQYRLGCCVRRGWWWRCRHWRRRRYFFSCSEDWWFRPQVCRCASLLFAPHFSHPTVPIYQWSFVLHLCLGDTPDFIYRILMSFFDVRRTFETVSPPLSSLQFQSPQFFRDEIFQSIHRIVVSQLSSFASLFAPQIDLIKFSAFYHRQSWLTLGKSLHRHLHNRVEVDVWLQCIGVCVGYRHCLSNCARSLHVRSRFEMQHLVNGPFANVCMYRWLLLRLSDVLNK